MPARNSRSSGRQGAKVTPQFPIRMAGYASRNKESQAVAQKLWAKALAIGDDRQDPAVLITVDNCVVPAELTEEWYDYVFVRDNVKGRMHEHWHHSGGCRSWLVVDRDTATHEIFAVTTARDYAEKGKL